MRARIPKSWAFSLNLMGAAGLAGLLAVLSLAFLAPNLRWILDRAPGLVLPFTLSLLLLGLRVAVHFGLRSGRVRYLSRREERRLTGGRLALGEAPALRPTPADRPDPPKLPFTSTGRLVGAAALALWVPAAVGAFVGWEARHYVALTALVGSIAVGLIWLGSQAARLAQLNSSSEEP